MSSTPSSKFKWLRTCAKCSCFHHTPSSTYEVTREEWNWALSLGKCWRYSFYHKCLIKSCCGVITSLYTATCQLFPWGLSVCRWSGLCLYEYLWLKQILLQRKAGAGWHPGTSLQGCLWRLPVLPITYPQPIPRSGCFWPVHPHLHHLLWQEPSPLVQFLKGKKSHRTFSAQEMILLRAQRVELCDNTYVSTSHQSSWFWNQPFFLLQEQKPTGKRLQQPELWEPSCKSHPDVMKKENLK